MDVGKEGIHIHVLPGGSSWSAPESQALVLWEMEDAVTEILEYEEALIKEI